MSNTDERISRALIIAHSYGQIDGAHHKAWVIDQMVRALLGAVKDSHPKADVLNEDYEAWVDEYRFPQMGDADGDEYEWDTGIAP